MKKTLKDKNGNIFAVIDDKVVNHSIIDINVNEPTDIDEYDISYGIMSNDEYTNFLVKINDVIDILDIIVLDFESYTLDNSSIYNCISGYRREYDHLNEHDYVEAVFDMEIKNDKIVYIDLENDSNCDIKITTYDKSKLEELLK